MTQPHRWTECTRDRILIVDGAMGTLLQMRGLPPDRCRSALNLQNPSMVLSIHEEYMRAGAHILETNTFDANYVQLKRYGLERQLREINRRGVELAREVAEHGECVFVAGSVGPLGSLMAPYGRLTLRDVIAIYEEQIGCLVDAGVDLLFIETQTSVVEARAALQAARRLTRIPVAVLMTCDATGRTPLGNRIERALYELAEAGADFVGMNCGIGPRDAYELIIRYLVNFPHPMIVMPNAGYPRVVAGQLTYPSTPEYFAEYAVLFVQAGVAIVGSCCGTTPEHTAAMARAVEHLRPTRPLRKAKPQPARTQDRTTLQIVSIPEEPETITFPERLRDVFPQGPILTVAVEPPQGWNYATVLEQVREFHLSGVHAVHIGDNPMGRLRMSPIALATLVKQSVGIEPIVHFTCRDRNLLAIQSELLGAAALGLRIILALTGDPMTPGEYPRVTTVFDVDSVGLIRILQNFNEGRNLAGQPIDVQTRFIIGSSANPHADPAGAEVERVREKIAQGATFFVTPPVYAVDVVQRFRDIIGPEIDLLVGILPPVRYRLAQFLHYEVPGVQVPVTLLERLAHVSPQEAETIALEFCRNLITQLLPWVDGFYLMLPFGQTRLFHPLLDAIRSAAPPASSHLQTPNT